MSANPLRIGIGGPVGSGKTALMEQLCKRLRGEFELAAITNDIYTKEDAEFLIRQGTLPADRVLGVETGGCPHAAIREDASMNLDAIDELESLAIEGLDSGNPIEIGPGYWEEKHRRLDERLKKTATR